MKYNKVWDSLEKYKKCFSDAKISTLTAIWCLHFTSTWVQLQFFCGVPNVASWLSILDFPFGFL